MKRNKRERSPVPEEEQEEVSTSEAPLRNEEEKSNSSLATSPVNKRSKQVNEQVSSDDTEVSLNDSSSSSSSSSSHNGVDEQDASAFSEGFSVSSSEDATVSASSEEDVGISGSVGVSDTKNAFEHANEVMRAWCKAKFNYAKIWYFEDFDFEKLLKIASCETEKLDYKTGSTIKVPGLQLEFNDEGHKYSAIQTPLGVLNFSTLNFEGSMHDTGNFAPKTPFDIKQGISWSPRVYSDDNRDPDDPEMSVEGSKFATFCKQFHVVWFMKQLMENSGKGGVKAYYDKVVSQLQDENKEKHNNYIAEMKAAKKPFNKAPPPPTPQEIAARFQMTFFLVFMRKDKRNSPQIACHTKLTRKANKKEITEFAIRPYRAPTPFLQDLYHKSNGTQVFNDIPIWTIRSQEELGETWHQNPSLYKRVPRELITIQNGTIGSIIYEPCPSVDAGNKCALMGYLKGVILYCPPTPLSSVIPGSGISTDEFPILAQPPVLRGAHCFYDETKPEHLRIQTPMNKYAVITDATNQYTQQQLESEDNPL